MRLSDIQIGRYGPIRNFSHQCEDDIEVFFGPNESGKTLLLESVLKLLSPDIESVFPMISRVSEQPSGHLYLEDGEGEHQIGDGVHLEDLSDITATQLRNVFVIRDGDLQLRDEHAFYDSVTQRIGDLHTNEIEAIQEKFVETGRLTSVDGRGLSSAGYRDNAKDVRNIANNLKDEIQSYIERAETEDIPGTEREFLSVKADLRRCEEELEVQRDAAARDRHKTLSARLSEYRDAIESIDDRFTSEDLEQLRDLKRQAENATDEIKRLTNRREELRGEIKDLEDDLQSIETDLAPVEAREDEIDRLEQTLERYRDNRTEAAGADSGMSIAKYAAIGGIGLGGVGAVIGSTVAGVVLALIGFGSLVWYWYQHRSVRQAEQDREAVLEEARDAGLQVDEVEDVAPAISEFRDRLASLEQKRDELEQDISVNEDLIEDVERQLEDQRDMQETSREEIQEILAVSGVDTIEEYAEAVEEQDELVNQRDSAEQSLVDSFGEPDAESADEKIEYWESNLDAIVEDVDEEITAEMYDAERLEELEEEQESLTSRRNELETELETHDERLTEFADLLHDVPTEPFIEASISLESRTLDGLREVVPDLQRLIDRIERDADVAREALDIFDGLKAEEEQKITDLFGPESRATRVFHRITGGRYENVTYDTGEQVLTVQQNGGDVYTADQLSQGTKTQLYLAARVGLGEQLLSTEPGFFLMDDAFLAADGTRLREGFEILQELADAGWQILYFTAKDEVGEDMVAVSDLSCRVLPQLT